MSRRQDRTGSCKSSARFLRTLRTQPEAESRTSDTSLDRLASRSYNPDNEMDPFLLPLFTSLFFGRLTALAELDALEIGDLALVVELDLVGSQDIHAIGD